MGAFLDYLREVGRSWVLWAFFVADIIGIVVLAGFADIETLPVAVGGVLAGVGFVWANFQVYRRHWSRRTTVTIEAADVVGRARRKLMSEVEATRAAVVDTLGKSRDPNATTLLRECSVNRTSAYTEDVQIRAALLLGHRGDEAAVPGLSVGLATEVPDQDRHPLALRIQCARAAYHVAKPMRKALIDTVAADPDDDVRREALQALEQLETGPDDVAVLALATGVDPPLVARLLANGGPDAVEPLVKLLDDPSARNEAARALRAIDTGSRRTPGRPMASAGIRALVDRLAVDVTAPPSAVDEYLGSVPARVLDALGLAPPVLSDTSTDPVITALADIGADAVPLLWSPACRPESHMSAVRALERIGAPALHDLVLLTVVEGRRHGVEWSEEERQELDVMVGRPVLRDLGGPPETTDTRDPAVVEALCWAGREQRELASRWLVRLGQRSREPLAAWANVALHLLWAGSLRPPEDVIRPLMADLESIASRDIDYLAAPGAMDRPFHANWLGATIGAAAALCRHDAVPALTRTAERFEAYTRSLTSLSLPQARTDAVAVASAARRALDRIAEQEPRHTLQQQPDWHWSVDR
jgi:HEAT repeat protein